MSVNSWEREVSKVAFLWEAYQLNIKVRRCFGRMPKKYKNSYLDYIYQAGFNTFGDLYDANSIMVNEFTPDADFKERRRLLRSGIKWANILALTTNVFLDGVQDIDGVNPHKADKVREEIGNAVMDVRSLTVNVIKSDVNRQAEYKLKRKIEKNKDKENDSNNVL